MYLDKPVHYQNSSLKTIETHPPDQRLQAWGKILSLEDNSIKIQDFSGERSFKVTKDQLKDLNKDLIIKVFGKRTTQDFSVEKVLLWNVSWEILQQTAQMEF